MVRSTGLALSCALLLACAAIPAANALPTAQAVTRAPADMAPCKTDTEKSLVDAEAKQFFDGFLKTNGGPPTVGAPRQIACGVSRDEQIAQMGAIVSLGILLDALEQAVSPPTECHGRCVVDINVPKKFVKDALAA